MTDAQARPALTAKSATTGLLLLLVALSVIAVGPAHLNHDAAWYLYVVQRWLGGATLYRDVVDTNPPLIIWLSTPAVWVAGLIGWPATALFKMFVFAVAAVSLTTVRGIVRRAWPDREFLIVAAAVFVALPFVKADFGQREHLAVLLTLPYVVAAARSAGMMSSRARWSIGVAAGLGFAIKPHFLAAWLAVEAAAVAGGGRKAFRRPEFVAVVAIGVVYALAVAIFTPAYFEVAGQVQRVYGGLNSPVAVLLRLREVQLWLGAVALFAAIRWPSGDRLPSALFAAGTGFLIAAVLQFKGWGYQLYPARAFLILFLAAAAGTLLKEVPSLTSLLRGGRRGLAFVFAGVLVAASARYIAEARRPAAPDLVAPMTEAFTYAPAGPVTVLSMRTIISPAFPAVNYSHATWGLRHNSLWFLPGFYTDQDRSAGGPLESHDLDSMPALERRFFDDIVDDLCASPPSLLAIEQTPPAAPAGRRSLDLRAYYSQSPKARRLLDAYHVQGTLGPFSLLTPATTATCQ
jgi:hypothetical protein